MAEKAGPASKPKQSKPTSPTHSHMVARKWLSSDKLPARSWCCRKQNESLPCNGTHALAAKQRPGEEMPHRNSSFWPPGGSWAGHWGQTRGTCQCSSQQATQSALASLLLTRILPERSPHAGICAGPHQIHCQNASFSVLDDNVSLKFSISHAIKQH